MLSLLEAWAGNLHAAQVAVRVEINTPTEVNLPWPYDESALQEPRGYNHHGDQWRRIMRQLIVENPGPRPISISDMVVEGSNQLGALHPSVAESPRALFTAWTLTRSHAASGSKAAQDPWQMLHFWGYTLCGEDTKAFGALLAARGIAGRSVPLNGHVAGEYNIDGRWSVLDGDQNIAYLNLDNTTLAGFAEIRADPFLALRTKPFGRFALPSVSASQFNAGLFEYIEPGASKPFKFKPSREAFSSESFTLYPGERLIYHYTSPVKAQAGDPNGPEWKRAAPSALRLVELQTTPAARGWKSGPLEVQTNYPILAAQNLETRDWAAVDTTELTFRCEVPVAEKLARVSVWMQRSQISFPTFQAGKNKVILQGGAKEAATVRLLYDAEHLPRQPAPPVTKSPGLFHDAAPVFMVQTEAGCDRIWWQISSDASFRFVPPNLEQIAKTSGTVELDPLASSFLNGQTRYYFRAKTVHVGVWSEWSEARAFQVEKLPPPTNLAVSALPDGRVRLQWRGSGEAFAIFASNRLDFLPDLYADEQIVSMRGLEVKAKRPNQNRVAVVQENALEFAPTGRYLRVIARSGGVWSNPSALFTLPEELCKGLPTPVVFQVRWTRVEGADPPDVYSGEERPLK